MEYVFPGLFGHAFIYLFNFFLSKYGLWKISKCVICLHQTPQHQRLPLRSHKNRRTSGFLPAQLHLSSISALLELKRQKPLMIWAARWRGCCQQNREGKGGKERWATKQTHFGWWLTSLHRFIIPVMFVQTRCSPRNRGLTLWLMQQSGVERLSACQPPGRKTHNHPPS